MSGMMKCDTTTDNEDTVQTENDKDTITMAVSSHEDLLNRLPAIIEEVDPLIPSWAARNKSSFSSLLSTSADVKLRLRHLALPSALNHLRGVKDVLKYTRGVNEAKENEKTEEIRSSVKADNLLPIHVGPMVAADQRVLEKFLNRLADGTSDGFTNICNLADSHNRISRALCRDPKQMKTCLEHEQERLITSERILAEKESQVARLSDEASSGIILAGCKKLTEELDARRTHLEVAEAAELAAKKIYEDAVSKRKLAASAVNSVKSTVETIQFQKDMLLKVSKLRIELEKYNKTSATSRIDMYQVVHTF